MKYCIPRFIYIFFSCLNKDLLSLSLASIFIYLLKLYYIVILQMYHMVSYVHKFTPLPSLNFRFIRRQNVCLRLVYSSTIYKIPLRKFSISSDSWKIAIGNGRISAKTGFKFACIRLSFWGFAVQSIIQVYESNKSG
jgi:hypothetical protein